MLNSSEIHFADVLSFNEFRGLDFVTGVLEKNEQGESRQGARTKNKQADEWKLSEDGKALYRLYRKL